MNEFLYEPLHKKFGMLFGLLIAKKKRKEKEQKKVFSIGKMYVEGDLVNMNLNWSNHISEDMLLQILFFSVVCPQIAAKNKYLV